MRVLVTGGAGFIGSHIVDGLLDAGHDVAVLDNFSSGVERTINPRAKIYKVDITKSQSLDDVFADVRPDIVNHHAAQISVRRSMADPCSDAQANIIGSVNILELCVNHNVSKLIFASTCAIYSEPAYIPMDESHPIRPQSAYGVAKHSAENYIRLFCDVYDLRYTILRYGNVYGPGQNPEGESGVIAIFARQMLTGTQSTIFGDGSKTRDYVFVEDVVAANLLAMKEIGDGEIFNISGGVEVSDSEIFETVRQVIDVPVKPFYGQKRPGEPDRVSLCITKARERLGWSPMATLIEGVQKSVNFQVGDKA